MVHSQLVYFDRDPSLWLTHSISGASHGFTGPATFATSVALTMASLATVGLFTSNRPKEAKYDSKDHAKTSTSFNSLARVTIFATLFYLIYTTIPASLICLSTVPIRTLAKPTPSHMSLASCLRKSTTILLANFRVLDQRVLRPSQGNVDGSSLPLCLATSAQRFVSWLLANDRPATYAPILMAISTSHKVALSFLSSAAGARPSLCISHKAALLALILGFTVTVQLVEAFTRVSALEQAALIALGLATMLGLDILASLPSLAFRSAHSEPKWQTATEHVIGAVILYSFRCYTKDLYNLRSYANILLRDRTTGTFDSITTQAIAIGVLLFPCLVASQVHSTINIVGLLRSQFATFTPATMQLSDSQQLIEKERPVANLTSIGMSKETSISQGLVEGGSQSTTTVTPTPNSRSNYGTIIRTHPSALYWKLANVYAWIISPNLRYRSIDGWEYTFNDSDLYDVYLLLGKAYKRVLDEILELVPTVSHPKNIETLVIKYMQEGRKELLHSLPNVSSGRRKDYRRPEYHHRQNTKSQVASSVSTRPLSPSHSDSSDLSEPTTPTEETREAAVRLKTGSRSLGNKIKAAMANPVNCQVQVQFVQKKFIAGLPPVVELDEED